MKVELQGHPLWNWQVLFLSFLEISENAPTTQQVSWQGKEVDWKLRYGFPIITQQDLNTRTQQLPDFQVDPHSYNRVRDFQNSGTLKSLAHPINPENLESLRIIASFQVESQTDCITAGKLLASKLRQAASLPFFSDITSINQFIYHACTEVFCRTVRKGITMLIEMKHHPIWGWESVFLHFPDFTDTTEKFHAEELCMLPGLILNMEGDVNFQNSLQQIHHDLEWFQKNEALRDQEECKNLVFAKTFTVTDLRNMQNQASMQVEDHNQCIQAGKWFAAIIRKNRSGPVDQGALSEIIRNAAQILLDERQRNRHLC